MLHLITNLTFLYAFAIVVILVYGILYYRSFIRNGRQRKGFPLVFGLIGAACFAFLWFSFHAPLRLKTFSNLDHHFIQHDGFRVAGETELGKTDTSRSNTSFNKFLFSKKGDQLTVSSSYAEEPFYVNAALVSTAYPAINHRISFTADTIQAGIRVTETFIELVAGSQAFSISKVIKKGSNCWNLFREDNTFINSLYYSNEKLISCLKSIYILQSNTAAGDAGKQTLTYFLSAKLFVFSATVNYDDKQLNQSSQNFTTRLANNDVVKWGLAADNQKNQFAVTYQGNDSFMLTNRYPVAYPLAGENKTDYSDHAVNKFLVSDARHIAGMPSVFAEGFLFNGDSSVDFAPALLTYRKEKGGVPVKPIVQSLYGNQKTIKSGNDGKIIIPSAAAGMEWIFSVRNTYNWKLGGTVYSPRQWQLFLFGSLSLFFLIVFFTSLIKPANRLSWVWQLLSCVTIVLLTTRFFLYWRYKTFPPFEGLDLPSRQQLDSFWNFGIILIACFVLAIVFGYDLFRFIIYQVKKLTGRSSGAAFYTTNEEDLFINNNRLENRISSNSLLKRIGTKTIYFGSWLLLLAGCGAVAAFQRFDPGTCRHLAIGLVVLYFIYVFISYRQSPLVAASDRSWWKLSTAQPTDLLVSNPVKVFLSISLLAVFAFIDIGFAIVFLNFLLFNEAFLCINYAVAGLSSGSRRNARLFGIAAFIYLSLFVINLLYAPYILKYLLELPQSLYVAGYILFAVLLSWNLSRLLISYSPRKKMLTASVTAAFLFAAAVLFFPKEKILQKAALTKYRINVLTMSADEAIESAYKAGDTWEPVIRAAQNQWFINTFIYEKNNPGVNKTSFQLLPHAPQNKGARYNAQATDLVASRFLIAEHGKWPVLLYVFLLLLPSILLASFYKLYPDFTNRINERYPVITAGFSVLNYLLITALLVILAATGRYIFFGQDLPFGSIVSKQSILFPVLLIIITVVLFKHIPPEQYANRKKFIPGLLVFAGLAVLLFFVKPAFNRNKEFTVTDLAKEMDSFIQLRLQPVMDHFDTSAGTRRFSMARKDQLFTDSVRRLTAGSIADEGNHFFLTEISNYTKAGFASHLDQRRMLYLDLYSGRPQLAVNENYFRIEPPPHLQQSWTGNVFGDTSVYNIALLNVRKGETITKRLQTYTNEPAMRLDEKLSVSFGVASADNLYNHLSLINTSSAALYIKSGNQTTLLQPKDSMQLFNPYNATITDASKQYEQLLSVEPDAFMKNYYVNGGRFYAYPMAEKFIWARNFAESIASEYSSQQQRNAFLSLDFMLMDSLAAKIQFALDKDTAYKKGAEYGICIADGNGRLIAMTDFIKGLNRPDPNDKAGFTKALVGDNGYISQSLLRKQIGNINLLRLNPGPGSTLKPIVFSAIASQLNLDWDAFSAEGFSTPQRYYGGEKVAEYDFEKNNGRISKVTDYLRVSDNYYHSNVLLLGSYPKQNLNTILTKHFETSRPDSGVHWPYFNYRGTQYRMEGFNNWPGYADGKANFGTDSSFVAVGLLQNFGICTKTRNGSFDKFCSAYDSSLFLNAQRTSGFVLPEYALFDQQGSGVDHHIPYDLFTTSFRGHVKGSSQVLVPPVKMLDVFGRLITQSRGYALTLNPYATAAPWSPFYVDNTIVYNNYLTIIRENIFEGMKQALFKGTAARLGGMLKDASPYYYYGKTGTTGDNEAKTKSKLFTLIISAKDVTDPDFNFRNNKFFTVYFTSQNGPAKQNEELQAAIINYLQQSAVFMKYMAGKN